MLSIEQLGLYIADYRYLAMFGILLISAMGIPIPEEPILIASGLAVGWGQAEFLPASIACVAGIIAGDLFLFTMGKYHLDRVLRLPPFRWIFTPKRQKRIQKLYEKHGGKTVLIGRFLPTIRFGVLVFAGQHGMKWRRFLALDLTAAIVSGPLTIFVGYFAARQIGDPANAAAYAEKIVQHGSHWIYAGILLFLAFLIGRALWRRRNATTAMQPPPAEARKDPGI